MKKKLAIVILVITIMALWVTPALAAQGTITEVSPSGIGTANNPPNDNGEGHASDNADGGHENRNDNAGNNGVGGFEENPGTGESPEASTP